MKHFQKLWFQCLIISLLLVGSFISVAYLFSWSWTGFQDKGLWDWLSLFIVPVTLASVAILFNQSSTRTERQIAQERYEQNLFQAYIDHISELLLDKGLRKSLEGDESRTIVKARTLNIMRQLHGQQMSDIFNFLRDSGLVSGSNSIFNLHNAWLAGANLSKVNLSHVDFSSAILSNADFTGTSLVQANLSDALITNTKFCDARLVGANLSKAYALAADLTETDLGLANLTEANFSFAKLTKANLTKADLTGANLTEADLTGANLSRAKLYRAKIDKSQLTPEQIVQAIWE